MLKIEAGKYYKTRDGEKVFVHRVVGEAGITPVAYCRKTDETYAIFGSPYEGNPACAGLRHGGAVSGDDIVAEWTEEISPIQEITQKRLIAGNYGIVKVENNRYNTKTAFISFQPVAYTADEILAAAKTLKEIGEFLNEA